MADLVLSVDVRSLADARKKLSAFQKEMNGLSVNRLVSGVNSVQNSIKQLVDAKAKGTIGFKTYKLGLEQLVGAYEKMGYSTAKATALVREYRKQLENQAAAKGAAQAAEELARAQAQVAARILDLKRRFKEGYAASEAMQMQFRDLDEALRRGIITLEEYRKQLERIKAGQTGFAASANNLANKMSRSSVAIQQFGYQTGDFLVQVQSGTNAFVAFGQQATQLAGLLTLSLNPKMVILGAALSILIPLGTAAAAMFARTRQEAEGAAEGVDDFDSAIKSLDSSLREWVRTKQAAELGITPEQMLGGEALSNAEEDLRSATEALARLQAAQEAIARMPMSPEGAVMALLFGSKADSTQAEIDAAVANVEAAQERLRTIRQMEEQERSTQQAKVESFIAEQTALLEDQTSLYSEIAKYGEKSAQVEEERARQARIAYQNELMRQKVGIELIPTLMKQYDDMVKAREESEDTVDALEELAGLNLGSLRAEIDFLIRRLNIGEEAARAMALAMPIGRSGGDAARGGRGITLGMGGRRPNFDMDLGIGRFADKPEGGAGAEGPNAIERLQQEIAFRQRTLNLSKEEKALQTEIFRITNALGEDRNKYSSDFIANLAQQNLAIQEQERVIEEARQQQEQLADSIANSFGDAFMSIVDGTKSTKDAFKDMARAIIADLYQMFVVKQITGFIGNAIMGAMGGGGPTRPVMRPTPQAAGGYQMPGRPYLVGENGPELVIPGRSGTVTNADLTRKSMGGSDAVNVVNNINVTGGTDPAAIRQEVAKLMPAITNATKTAVIDARRRGGQMKAAFQ
jgi:hypothetical protein